MLTVWSLAGGAIMFSAKVESAESTITDQRFAQLTKTQDLTVSLKEVRFRLVGVHLDHMPISGRRRGRKSMRGVPDCISPPPGGISAGCSPKGSFGCPFFSNVLPP